MESAIHAFHPIVRKWFGARFDAPAPIQEQGWPAIGAGHNTLLCAPTGSGKTLAAFLWAINRLVSDAETGVLRDEVSVLYVSPLRALANDIRLNLDEPLAGVAEAARAIGARLAPIRAGLRTGDTPAAQRSAMLRRPPHILVTTPESLFILLTSARFREKLRAVRWVIVDELHALAGNKRGAHLAATLERLTRLVRQSQSQPPVRIGLSATLSPIDELARFLSGAEVEADGMRRSRPCRIIRGDDRPRELDLEVIAPGPDLGPIATHEHWDAMYDRVADLIREHRTTLVFTLSRRWAERVALALQKRLGDDAVMAHHSSLARAERLAAEQRLKRGELRAIVATASLELGIDVGAVDLVCQIDSPKTISAAIQRIGRSGHALGQTPKGRFFALTLDDLLECAAAVRAIRRGDLDAIEIPRGCLDVAAQQIVAIAAEEGEIGEAELLRTLRGAYNFADLDSLALRRLLAQMVEEIPQKISGAQPKIFYDRRAAAVRPRRIARIAAITGGGTIPESGNYDVVIESSQRKIGDVEEDFAQESSRGDIFSLGSMPWQISRISRGRLMVEAAPGMAPTLPFWQTEAAGRTPALSAAVCALRHEIARRLSNGDGAAEHFLISECALDKRAAVQAVDYVRRGLAALGAIPDAQTIVAERFFDGLGGTQIVIHSPLGIRLNRGFGLALRKRLCQSFDFEIQASAIDDGVLLALHSRHSFPLEEIFTMLTPATVEKALLQAVMAGPMFEVRWRHVATRALAIMRSNKGRQVPAWIQRLRAQDLLIGIFPAQQACQDNRPPDVEIPDHFIVNEALRECCEESTDLPRLKLLLEDIRAGRVRTLAVDSIAPSVFAHRLLLAWDYSFLDDGERANRRSRTVQMNRAMAEEVLRTEDVSEMLAEAAVAQVSAEATGLAPTARARGADELHELIRRHGALDEEAIAARVAGDSSALLEQMVAAGRVARLRLPHRSAPAFVSAEDEALFAAAYGLGVAGSATSVSEPDAAREEIVRRALRTSGPLTAPALARSLGFAPGDTLRYLLAAEAGGSAFRGRFTQADGEQWCDRYNLERIHRLTLDRIRSEIEPCSDSEYTAFCLRWHHIGGADLPSGAEGVAMVLEQLAAIPFPTQLWERAVLPARIPDYRPEYLDLLCLGGQFQWVAMGEANADREVPERVAFVPRGASFWCAFADGAQGQAARADDAKTAPILSALQDGGAQYLDQIAEIGDCAEREALRILWRLVAAGRVTNDSFAPLRLLSSAPGAAEAFAPASSNHKRFSRYEAGLRARLKSSIGGRWSVVGAQATRSKKAGQADEREPAAALLRAYGIVSREIASAAAGPSWSDLLMSLRRMEYGGQIRRGYFVRSLSGEQYALPEAVEMLEALRAAPPAKSPTVALSAVDPANPFGLSLAGCGISRDSGNVIAFAGGAAIIAVTGRELRTLAQIDSDGLAAAIRAIIQIKPRLRLDQIDEEPALRCARVSEFAALGFHSDGRALVYDGLPGPAPARVRARGSTLTA